MAPHPTTLLALLSAVILSGCPRHPMSFGARGEIKDAKVLFEELDRRSAKVLGLKAEAKVKVVTPGQSGSVGEFIAVLRPSGLHLETLNFFGKPVAVLVSDGEKFALFAEENGAYYTGPATARNVSRLLPLVLEPTEAVLLLLGDLPRIPGAEVTLALDDARRAYLVTLTRGEITQRLWIATEDLTPLRSEIRGAAAYDFSLEDYETKDGLRFPMTLHIVTVDRKGEPSGTEVTVKYKDLELNPPVDLSLFMLARPPNTTLIEVDENGMQKDDSGARTPAPSLPLPLQKDGDAKP